MAEKGRRREGFVVDKVAMEHVFSEYFDLLLSVPFH